VSDHSPILSPSPKLVEEWWDLIPGRSTDWKRQLCTQAAQWGADQELEACCREVQTLYSGGSRLRARRRPRPLTRKERALKALDGLVLPEDAFEIICFALEALPND
jgi:hypothetical protein